MNCAEFKETVGALALGALEPSEEAACAEHLEVTPVHQGCHEAYARALVTAGKLATSLTPVKPGASVWAGVEAALDGESRTSRPRRLAAAAGWAVAIAATIALIYIWLDRRQAQTQIQLAHTQVQQARGQIQEAEVKANTQQEAARRCQESLDQVNSILGGSDQRTQDAIALANRPGTQHIPMKPFGDTTGYTANIIYNPREKRAFIVAVASRPVPDKGLEMWVMRDLQHPQEAKMMETRAGAFAVGEVDAEVLGRVLTRGVRGLVAISLEEKAGSPTHLPTQVLLFAQVVG